MRNPTPNYSPLRCKVSLAGEKCIPAQIHQCLRPPSVLPPTQPVPEDWGCAPRRRRPCRARVGPALRAPDGPTGDGPSSRDPDCLSPALQTAGTSQPAGGKRFTQDHPQEPSGLFKLRHRISLPNKLIHVFISSQLLKYQISVKSHLKNLETL